MMKTEHVVMRLVVAMAQWQRSFMRDGDDPERGDVPGWVFVTMMSAALVGAIYLVAGPALETMLSDALSAVLP